MKEKADIPNMKPTRVMIIDDTLEDIIIVKKAIQKIDPQCIFNYVFDGDEAITILEEKKSSPEKLPHFIFLDLFMPRIGGYQILDWIKKDEQLSYIPIILFSSTDGNDDIIKAYNLRANAFISKQSINTNFVLTIQATYKFWSQTASLLSFS
ncbi:MAG: response regulator [Bacteroidia bacterium]